MEISIKSIRNIVSKPQGASQQMDLDYQSHGNVDIVKQLNRLDKLTSKLSLTLKDMPESQMISKQQKEQLVKIVSSDKAALLAKYMEKEVIAADREIGAKGTRWNLLHVCAKHDAVECMKHIVKKIYQEDAEEYLHIVNRQTAEGYTPLMVCIIHQANRTLQLLLRLGGSDLSIMEASKLRAYDLALNYHNEKAIQELIVYEDRCKKQMYLNKQELTEENQLLEEEKGWFKSTMDCLFDYLLCLNREEAENDNNNEPAGNMMLLKKFSNLLKGQEKVEEIDAVKIGSRRDIQDYEIEWRKLSSIPGQKFVLFDSFKPTDISENQFSLRNNLILFQALSDYSWIVKRAISKMDNNSSKNKSKNQLHKFAVNLYKNFMPIKLEIDENIPFVKERGEIMFLSNQNQIWPLMLQKGLAKFYSSYIELNSLVPCETLEDITGFYSHSLPITAFNPKTLIADLQELNMKGYLLLLEGREKTDLNSSASSQIYSVLNYYQKGNTKKILVNCPNVVQKWKQPKENRQLAIIKAHFNKHNQSCVWIDEHKLDYYFKSVAVCYLKENYLRSELKIKMKVKDEEDSSNKDIVEDGERLVSNYKKAIFFRFKVEKKTDDSIVLQLIDLETKHRFDLSSLSGWKNQGTEILIHESQSQNCKELAKLTCEPGEYTCMYEISQKQVIKKGQNHSELNKSIIKGKKQQESQLKSMPSQLKQGEETKKRVKLNLGPEHLKELLLLSWWAEPLQIEYLQDQFGAIEWLSHFKNYSIANWSQLMKGKQEEDCFLYESVNHKTILLIKNKTAKKAYLQLSGLDWKKSNSLIEGNAVQLSEGHCIEMVQQSKNASFFYAVVSNVWVQEYERQKKVRFLYEY